MKLIIQNASGENHNIKLPTGILLNRVSAGIVSGVLKKYDVEISKKQLTELMKVAKTYKKHHPEWKLIEVDDAGGEHVEIII